jgi:hypothetical protein
MPPRAAPRTTTPRELLFLFLGSIVVTIAVIYAVVPSSPGSDPVEQIIPSRTGASSSSSSSSSKSASSSGRGRVVSAKEHSERSKDTAVDFPRFFRDDWLINNPQIEAEMDKVRFEHVGEPKHGLGYRTVVVKAVRAKEDLMCVPSGSLVIDAKAVKDQPDLMPVSWPEALDDDMALLAVFILREKYKASQSSWAPFVDSLPLSFAHMPQFWTAPERAQFQMGDEELAVVSGADARAAYDLLAREVFPKHKAIFGWGLAQESERSSPFSRHNFDWAYAAAKARAFNLPANMPSQGDLQRPAFIPGLDLARFHVNAFKDPAVHLSEAELKVRKDGMVCLRADKAYAKGEQLLITYKGWSNFELLQRFGIAYYPNTHDQAPVFVRIPSSDPAQAAKLAALRKAGYRIGRGGLVRTAVSTLEEYPSRALAVLRVLHFRAATDDDFTEAVADRALCAASPNRKVLSARPDPDFAICGLSAENERLAEVALEDMLRASDDKITSDEAEDKRILLEMGTDQRLRIAAAYRRGAHDALKKHLAILRAKK